VRPGSFERWFGVLYLSVPFTWAASFIAARFVVAEIDPLRSVVWRFALSALALLPFLVAFRRRQHPDLTRPANLRHLAVVVGLAGICYHLLFFWALTHATPTNASLVIGLNPFFTAVGEVLLLRRPRPARFYVGFALALVGAALVILLRGGGFARPGLGELLCLLAALSWSAYALITGATRAEGWDPLWTNAYGYLLTALLLLPFAGIWRGQALWAGLTLKGWLGCVYMGVFPTAIGYTLFYLAVQRRGPGWASAFVYLVPPLTALLDHLVFAARLTPAMLGGTALVVLGLAVGTLERRGAGPAGRGPTAG
jgi:drug/metabolite transporter (DMT)-like permease